MPIDFPTRKLADRAATTPTAPAADDTLQGQTVGGTDRVFLLGNLAGLAPLTMAADQSAYYNGTTWATYSLTTVGRTLLAATTQAAQRAAIGAADDTAVVHLTGAETVNGIKTFTAASIWNLTATLRIQYGTPAGMAGITFFNGTPGAGMRGDIRVGSQSIYLIAPSGNNDDATGNGILIQTTAIRPSADNQLSMGASGSRYTQVWAVNAAINTSDARLKTEPRQLRDAEFKAASAIARLPAVWRWLSRVHGDENCEPEGREARKHFGPTVQAAIAVMEAHELDPFAYSFICYDQWEALEEKWHEWPAADAVIDEEGNVLEPAVEAGRELVQAAREARDRYSFRKEELLCFLVSAMARQHDELMERVAALEAKLTE